MDQSQNYFLCGIGGSGMLPLALLLKARGSRVEGSDRALDQGRTAAKFAYLEQEGVRLHRQDGSGITGGDQIVVASAAVEETTPDLAAAKARGAKVLRRPELLAALFNAAETPIGVAGTSGKSTTTAMAGWILDTAGRDPTIMNGAVMKNYATPAALFASARVGAGSAFVAEIDESDGSIAYFRPKIAALNNIALDHKSIEELRRLFSAFVAGAEVAVINLDNAEAAALAPAAKAAITYGVDRADARLVARDITPRAWGSVFTVSDRASGATSDVALKVPGRHNVSNALAAIGVALAAGVDLSTAAAALGAFEGVKRRLEIVGVSNGVVVIDDFAHNPDKISATLRTLREQDGRILALFQPHGYGPLKLMGAELVDVFAHYLQADDLLLIPEPLYFGGTADKSVSSRDLAEALRARGVKAAAFAIREETTGPLIAAARPGDRIVVMGARDDTLSQFAADLLHRL